LVTLDWPGNSGFEEYSWFSTIEEHELVACVPGKYRVDAVYVVPFYQEVAGPSYWLTMLLIVPTFLSLSLNPVFPTNSVRSNHCIAMKWSTPIEIHLFQC
jgi:hypothetical protein